LIKTLSIAIKHETLQKRKQKTKRSLIEAYRRKQIE